MSNNLPYFKFIVAEWLTGDIVFEDFDIQGLFVNVCALYWQRQGKLSINDINSRYKNPVQLPKLTDRFISVVDGFISIKFLDEQLHDRKQLSFTNSKNGKKGGRPKYLKTLEEKPSANRALTDRKANESNIEKKRKEKKREYSTPTLEVFLEYVKEKLPNDFNSLRFSLTLKHQSWVENNWHDGNGKEIKNWKTTILNTIPYLSKSNNGNKERKPDMIEQGILNALNRKNDITSRS